MSGQDQDQAVLFLNETWLIFDREVIKQTDGCKGVLTIVTGIPGIVYYLGTSCSHMAEAQRLFLLIQWFARV